ncbi:MAG: glycosyltransferase family 2 protein [Candidatus Kerfeldbacteria bacterium]
MDASIIIVSWNVRDLLSKCLQSIYTYTNDLDFEVIVVDNASTDGSAAMVKDTFPQARLIENDANVGFAAANNQGAKDAKGRVLVFLNDDVQLTSNAVERMVRQIESDNSIGVLGCRMKFPDGSHQDSVRHFPGVRDQLLILLKLHNIFPTLPALRRYFATGMDYNKEQKVDQVMGACMVIRNEIFKRVNGFDDGYRLWFEEVDLQKRIQKRLGLSAVYTPNVEIIHVKGASFFQNLSLQNQAYLNRSMRRYFHRHHSPGAYLLIAALQPFSYALAAIAQLFQKTGVDIKKYKHGHD